MLSLRRVALVCIAQSRAYGVTGVPWQAVHDREGFVLSNEAPAAAACTNPVPLAPSKALRTCTPPDRMVARSLLFLCTK